MTPFDAEQELQRHGASLRALAAALLRCDHAADDAVQETWTRALEKPPREPGPAGGWLHMVLRNFAWKQRRAEARRSERELQAARPEAVPSAGAVAARRESLRLVVDAVLALEEPYQGTLWQRYFEERLPAEIAARTGVSVATVKSRLQRGLLLLRERLDRRRGGWRAGLASAFGLQPMMAAGAAAAAGGVIAMGTGVKVTLAAAALLCGAVVYVLSGEERPVPVGEASAKQPVAGKETASSVAAEGERKEEPAAQRSAVATEAEPAEDLRHPYAYEVHCLVLDRDGLPVAGAEVFAGPIDGTLDSWPQATGEDGTATVAFRGRTDGMTIAFGVRSGGESSLRRLEAHAGRTEVVVGGKQGKEARNSYTITFTGEGGTTGRLALADNVKLFGALTSQLDVKDGGGADNGHPPIAEGVDCRTCHQTTTVARNAFDGAPAMGAVLHPHASFAEAAQGEKHDLVTLRSKERLYSVRSLAISLDAASFEQVLSRKAGELVLGAAVTAGKNGPQTTIEGTVYGEDGKPAPGVTVICGGAVDRATARTSTDKQGNFKIKDTGVTGWAELRAGGGNGGLRRARLFLQEGQGNRWDPVLERGATIRGRAVDDAGAPLEGWVIELEGLNTGWNDECTVQKGGAFELPNLPGGSFRLLAWAKDGGRKLPAALIPSVLADNGEVVVTVPKQRGGLKVTPFLPAGLVDVPVEVRAFQEASGRGAALVRGKKNDVFSIGGLPPGWYRVQVGGDQLGWLDLGPQWCDGTGECDLGKVSLLPGGTLRVQRDAPEGGKERNEELCRRTPWCDVRMPFASGGEGVAVPAGQYLYLWREGDGELHYRSVEVQSGRETVLDLRAGEGR